MNPGGPAERGAKWAGDWGWRGAAGGPRASGLGGGEACACPVLCGASRCPRRLPVFCALSAMCFPAVSCRGLPLHTAGLCVQLAAAWPVCGCGSVGASLGTRLPPGLGLRAPAWPLILLPAALWGMECGGRLPLSHLLSGLRVMCCLGSWMGK